MLSAKILAPLFVVLLMVVATTGGGIQNVWAAKTHVLLSDDSPTWKRSSSGDKSPDGVWEVKHPGKGYAKVLKEDGDKVLRLAPKLGDHSRHSTLVLADDIGMKGVHGKMQVRLDKQGATDKSWDTFWAMLAYVDQTTHITLTIKSDDGGWMVSKRDHDHEGKDQHEVLAKGDSIKEVDKGHWYKVEWWIDPHGDDLHIKVKVDGKTLIDKDDDGHWDRDGHKGDGTSSHLLKSDKTVGAYSEKSQTSWKDFTVESMS
jgi:hypothetical protein